MTYFYNCFAREYREKRKEYLLPDPSVIFQNIELKDVQSCRQVLKREFANYHNGRNIEVLKRLFGEYQKYVSGCYNKQARDRYNAFVYRYMLEVPVCSRAIATKLGVVRETVLNYVNRCIDEILILCMGVLGVMKPLEGREAMVRILIDGSRLFSTIAEDYVLCLFPGKREQMVVEQGRWITRQIMGQLSEATEAYLGYCNDQYTRIDTDIRKAEILEKCISGVPPAAIAEEYGCCESTIYADIRENERRLAAMLFNIEKGE